MSNQELIAPTNDGLPVGTIILFNGLPYQVPPNWAICNGTNNTPNLAGLFVVGAGEDNPIGAKGGSSSTTITIAQMPAHNHGINDPGHSHQNSTNFPLRGTSVSSSGSGTPLYASNGDTDNYTTAGDNVTGITTQDKGGGQPLSTVPPFYTLYYLMKIK